MTKINCFFLIGVLGMVALLLPGCVAVEKGVKQPPVAWQSLNGNTATTQAAKAKQHHPDSGFMALSELTDAFARELAKTAEMKTLYLDRTKIWDANTRDVVNFSTYLENEVVASLSPLFQLAYDPSEADYLIGVVFQQYGNSVRIFFKCRTQDGQLFRSMDYSIARSYLPEDSFEENLRSKAYKLAANILPDDKLKVYVNPVRLDSCNCVTDFSRSFTTLLRTEIVRQYPEVQVQTEMPVAVSMRGLEEKAAETDQKRAKEITTTDAAFAGADWVLDGHYFINGNTVVVNVDCKDLQGRVSSSYSVDIARKIISARLDNPKAAVLADLADKKQEIGNDIVKISTSRGSGDPIYHDNENLQFWVMAKKPVYLYIYDITNRSEVALIYPYTLDSPQQPLFPGKVKVLPEEGGAFEYKVVPPYGLDVVKVFASSSQLPIPELVKSEVSLSYSGGTRAIRVQSVERTRVQDTLSGRRTINPDDLVDYYRGLASKLGVEVYEDSVIVETRP